MNKYILIDAIVGKGLGYNYFAELMVKRGLAEFTGNQWNPDWAWNRQALDKLTTLELEEIYADKQDIKQPEIEYEDSEVNMQDWWVKKIDQIIFEHLVGERISTSKQWVRN